MTTHIVYDTVYNVAGRPSVVGSNHGTGGSPRILSPLLSRSTWIHLLPFLCADNICRNQGRWVWKTPIEDGS
jgi:hypothetical protein